MISPRGKQPMGTTCKMVADVLFNTIHVDVIKEAKACKRLFHYKLQGKRNDNESVYKFKEFLGSVKGIAQAKLSWPKL